MAHQDQKIASLLDNTFSAIGSDVSATTPDAGADLIQEWIYVVRSDVSTQWVAEPLEKLQRAIQSHDMHDTEKLMYDLSGITVDFATNTATGEYKEELQNLSTVLKDFAQGVSKANTH